MVNGASLPESLLKVWFYVILSMVALCYAPGSSRLLSTVAGTASRMQ
jgi:hypothetical protein